MMNRLLDARATWLDVFSLWSTLSEQKWATSRERRGTLEQCELFTEEEILGGQGGARPEA